MCRGTKSGTYTASISTTDRPVTRASIAAGPLSLTYDQLRKMTSRTQAITLECAGNERGRLVPKTKGVQWGTGAVSTAEQSRLAEAQAQRLAVADAIRQRVEAAGRAVAAPVPLGAMGRRLQEILEMPVQQRPVDLYAALAEVAR